MTMAAPSLGDHEMAVGSEAAKLQATLGELRRQTDAAVEGLESITARTSRVLAATEAFSALSTECRALSRVLFDPLAVARINDNAVRRNAFRQQLQQLLERFDALRQSYAAELSPVVQPRSAAKKPWWRLFS